MFATPLRLMLGLCWLCIQLPLSATAHDSAYPDILQVVQYYYEGENLLDLDKLARAYHPQARLTFLDPSGGSCRQLTFGAFLKALRGDGQKPAGRALRLQRYDRTGQVALVQTTISEAGDHRRLHDYLVLMEVEGEWRITSRTTRLERARFAPREASAREVRRDGQQVRQTLEAYLRQRRRYQAGDWQSLFHPQAHIVAIHPRYARVQTLDRTDYLQAYASEPEQRPRLASQIEELYVEGDMALAKVTIHAPQLHGTVTDYVVMVREGNRWQILDKASYKDPQALLLPV
ncbi:MAG: DUF4440 domain-containing protein [Bacteroidetes bacterium]|nr:MAG: DUF4440 domain-containing protein [Bacteroidota bacterium]